MLRKTWPETDFCQKVPKTFLGRGFLPWVGRVTRNTNIFFPRLKRLRIHYKSYCMKLNQFVCSLSVCAHVFRVILRGNKSDSAVLCTGDKTYDVKARETSNTLLLTQDTTLPEETKLETQPIAHRKVMGQPLNKSNV